MRKIVARGRLAAFRAVSSDDDFIRADAAVAGTGPGQRGNIEPFEVFDGTATIAHEVMVRVQKSVVTGGAGVEFEFADESGFDEGMESVVDGGAGGAGVAAVERGPEFIDGGVVGMAQQEVQNRDALRGAAQAGG